MKFLNILSCADNGTKKNKTIVVFFVVVLFVVVVFAIVTFVVVVLIIIIIIRAITIRQEVFSKNPVDGTNREKITKNFKTPTNPKLKIWPHPSKKRVG